MLITYREYPYPVLSYFNDDYQEQQFQSNIELTTEDGILRLKIDINLTSNDLNDLIKNNIAEYVVHIECKSTRFRKKYTSQENQVEILINQDEINQDVEILIVVVAKQNINNFTSVEFNEDFLGIQFDLEKGDILAVDTNKIVSVEKNENHLKKTPSIFAITALNNDKESLNWELSEDKILIKLSKSNFEKYKSISGHPQFKSVLASLIVLPVLTEILCNYKELEDEYEDSRWFKVIKKQLLKADVSMNNSNQAVAIAQKILPGLLEKSLSNIENILMHAGE